jgi:hypothetical protein
VATSQGLQQFAGYRAEALPNAIRNAIFDNDCGYLVVRDRHERLSVRVGLSEPSRRIVDAPQSERMFLGGQLQSIVLLTHLCFLQAYALLRIFFQKSAKQVQAILRLRRGCAHPFAAQRLRYVVVSYRDDLHQEVLVGCIERRFAKKQAVQSHAECPHVDRICDWRAGWVQ